MPPSAARLISVQRTGASSGLPVVSFNCAAAAEHVDDGISGRLAVPGDEAGFIAATAAFAVAPATLQSFREAAVAAARRATWDEVLERFETRLQDTVDAFQASPAPVPVVA